MKRKIFLTALFCAVLTLFGVLASASEADDDRMFRFFAPRELNPLYEGEAEILFRTPALLSEEDEDIPEPSVFRRTASEAAADLRGGMVQRMNDIVVGYLTREEHDWYVLAREFFNIALIPTEAPYEGDYLTWQWQDREITVWVEEKDGWYSLTVRYIIHYYTTVEMEEELSRAIDDVLEELDLSEGTDYEKIKGIYDYICTNVKYDNANVNNAEYTLKYTAYAALMHKTAVCQGYAVLYYRLAAELGVESRVIFGKAGSTYHTWMIVKIGDSYFYMDPTWDRGKDEYRYFLKGEGDFPGHTRIDNPLCGLNYTTPAFYAAYPVAKRSFTESPIPEDGVSGAAGEKLTWHLGADGRLVICGEGWVTDSPWDEYAPFIREIVIGKEIGGIGASVFSECTDVRTVSLPDPGIAVDENAFSPSTEVVYAEKKPLALTGESPCVIIVSADGTRYLIAEELPCDIVSFAANFELKAADRVQILSADGLTRHTSLDGVNAGDRIQLLDGKGGIADELAVALWGDFDLDGDTDDADAVVLLWSFLKPDSYPFVPQYDLNGDGLSNASDAAAIGG